jgi:putative DNA primase/helicase
MKAVELASALGKPQRESRGWRCLCPAHDDHQASLSLTEKDDKLLVICRAGCDQAAVIDALKSRGLWPQPSQSHTGPIEFVYDYRDETGALRYQVVRRSLNGEEKKFIQRRPNRAGGWIWNMQGVAPLPYRLSELIASDNNDIVCIPEGEKDCDSLAAIGIIATTNHGGAGKWRRELSQWLTGRDVVILPDNDEPGRKHAETVARHLFGTASRIRILALPGLREKADVSDWLSSGGTAEQLLELMKSAPLFQPAAEKDEEDEAFDDDVEIQRLAKLKPLAFERDAKASAKRLGCPVALLRKLVARERDRGSNGIDGQGRPIEFAEIDAWPEPVDGGDLLDALVAAITNYVILDDDAARGCALWVVFTHCFAAAWFAPKLLISSPQKRSGKTRLLRVLKYLVPRPLTTSNASPAALFRVIDEHCPTLLIDESDTFVRDDKELQGLLNSGFDRGDGFVRSVAVGDGWEPRLFIPWCPQAIAGIGKLHDTTEDRGFRISLKRKLPTDKVLQLRERDAGPLQELARKTARWAKDHLARLEHSNPAVPSTIHDRAADAWTLCFAIAELAGGQWPGWAHAVASVLSGEDADDEGNHPVMLLADIRAIFAARWGRLDEGRISSADLVRHLMMLDDRPWAEMGRARKPITENRVARLLKTFKDKRLKPTTIDFGGAKAKGYYQAAFRDAFARWLPLSDVPF